MPEVIRIERAWPTPGTEDNIRTVYPAQKRDAIASLELFRRAIEAAEKASPTTIAAQGAAAIRKGRGVWTGAGSVPRAQLAQFWMSWSPPAKCEETARALEARSLLFGQALTANAGAAAPTPRADTPVEAQADPFAIVETAAAGEAETPAPIDPVDPVAAVETAGLTERPSDPDEASAVGLAEAETEAEAEAGAPSAIDDLLPAPAEADPVAEAPVAPVAPVAKPAPPAPAKPASTRKPGLRDTLKGLRGPQ